MTNKPSLMIAVGCSWVAGCAIDTDPLATEYDYEHKEDPEFVCKHSFSGILQRQLGFDHIKFLARSGASNDEQERKLVSFIDRNRDQYSQVFVLWGLTSIYRWQTYSARQNCVATFMFGLYQETAADLELKNYYKNFWDKQHELEKLNQRVLLINHYLKGMNVDHLIFNSFQTFMPTMQVDNFYHKDTANNDMLSFLCRTADVPVGTRPWLNLFNEPDRQLNTKAVEQLQQKGWLDLATAHPTVKAHRAIADELYQYIRDTTK